MGIIGSHMDITSGRRRHKAKPVAFPHPPRDYSPVEGRDSLGLLVLRISQKESLAGQAGSSEPAGNRYPKL
jgi:hypothetical protein